MLNTFARIGESSGEIFFKTITGMLSGPVAFVLSRPLIRLMIQTANCSNIIHFRSECDMKRRTCGQLVVVAPLANCEGTKYCSTNLAAPRCPRSKKNKMICGSDNQFYSNECQMKRENCG